MRIRNSAERLSSTNLNANSNVNTKMNVVKNENLRTGREVLTSTYISPQTPTSPQGRLLGDSGGQPPLEEARIAAREPVASRLEGLSLGQEGRHRIKVDHQYLYKVISTF